MFGIAASLGRAQCPVIYALAVMLALGPSPFASSLKPFMVRWWGTLLTRAAPQFPAQR